MSILNDIALLILDRDVTLNENIQIACIPNASSNTYPGTNVDGWIVGWGLRFFLILTKDFETQKSVL